jgi:hypothetical protein
MLRFVPVLGALLMINLPSLIACEGCKEPSNVAGDSGVAGISASFSWSVVFMLGMLAFLIGGMVLMMVRSCQQLADQQEQAEFGVQRSTFSVQRAPFEIPVIFRRLLHFVVPIRPGFENQSEEIPDSAQ